MNFQTARSFCINDVIVDLDGGLVRDRDGREIDLRPQSFQVLLYLLKNAGRLVTKDELMQAVWPGVFVTDDSLVQCVRDVRRALRDEQQSVLKAVPKRGYRLVIAAANPASAPARWRWTAAALGLLGLSAAVWFIGPAAERSSDAILPSVAVLPFDNYGGDQATGRLADGVTEDIITDLAGFPEFQVIARNSTEQYRGKPAVPSEVGKSLGAAFVVEGSIQRQADRVRVTAQLIDAPTGKHLWSQRWDRPDEELFAIQTEISEQISNRLGGGAGLVQEAGRIIAHRKPPENLNAYELYLLGTEKLEQVNKADVEEAVRLLTRAVELDPSLARAWVELSHSHGILAGFGVEPDRSRVLASEAAERALHLDPSDAEAHAAYAMIVGDKGEIERAKAEFDTALRLAPGNFEVLTFYIDQASSLGEPERGAQLVDKALRLNPAFPMWSARIFAHAYFMAGRYEDAQRMLERLTPENYGRKHWVMRSGALAALGRTEEAKVSVAETLRRFPNLTVEGFVNQSVFNEAERQRLVKAMLLVGFPDCAKAEELAKIEKPLRLPACASP